MLLLFSGSGANETRSLRPIASQVQQRYGVQVAPYVVVRADRATDADVICDGSGELHARYGARGACLYLIRPDGFIGYRSQPPDSARLLEYLQTVLVPAPSSR